MSARLLLPLFLAIQVGCGRTPGDAEIPAAKNPSPPPAVQTDGGPLKTAPEAKVPVKKPTVIGTRELAKILDLGALPHMAETVFTQKIAAHVSGTAPASIPDVLEHYRTKLASLGWETVPMPGYKVTEEYGGLQFAKDGHTAFLFTGKGFGGTKDAPKTSLNFVFHGNFDCRTLPIRDSKFEDHATATSASYSSKNSIVDEGAWTSKALLDSGWQEFTAYDMKPQKVQKNVLRSFRKDGYVLQLYVSKYTPDGDTKVLYRTHVSPRDVPAPPDAVKIEFDPEQIGLRCEVPGDLKAPVEFYKKAMPAAGYKSLPDDDPKPNFVSLAFGTDEGNVVKVQMLNLKGEKTHVEILTTTGTMATKIKEKDTKKEPAIDAPPLPPAKQLEVADVPLPKDAKGVVRSQAKEEIAFRVAGPIEPVAGELREQLEAAGWQEEKAFAVANKNLTVLSFKQAKAALRITLVNTGLGDGTQGTIHATGLAWTKKGA